MSQPWLFQCRHCGRHRRRGRGNSSQRRARSGDSGPSGASCLCDGRDISGVTAANDAAAARAQTAGMFSPSTKEPTMKRFVAVLFAAILVTLVVTAIGSARTGHRSTHSAPTVVKLGLHHHRLLI